MQNGYVTRLRLSVPSSQRRLGPSPLQELKNTADWIPAFAGMTNGFIEIRDGAVQC